jgi:MFS family permease
MSKSHPWLVVAGCLLACAVTHGPIMAYGFSLFIEPLTREFGWSRSMLSLAYASATLAAALSMPLMGRLCDRHGVRYVMLRVVPLYAAAIALLAATPANAVAFVALYALLGVLGGGQSPVPYAKVASSWFDSGRGLALGVTMTGIGLGGALVPQIARVLIDQVGWRGAYAGLGAMVFLVAFPALHLLVQERTVEVFASDSRNVSRGAPPGASREEALRDRRFWYMTLSVFLIAMMIKLRPCCWRSQCPPWPAGSCSEFCSIATLRRMWRRSTSSPRWLACS